MPRIVKNQVEAGEPAAILPFEVTEAQQRWLPRGYWGKRGDSLRRALRDRRRSSGCGNLD
jgi:hypothetical protein